jgi:TetR/AcrR family transcriptional regulator, transcriptional repressor for nem operon
LAFRGIWFRLDGFKLTGHIYLMPRRSLKEQIVDAAVETLYRKGFNGSSVQDITEATKAPKGSFYNYFESKKDLAVAALQRYWERSESSRAMLRDTHYPPLERLHRYLDHLTNSARTARDNRLVRARPAALFGAWTAAIEACVREAQADGSIRRDLDPASIAVFLLRSWEGALLRG